MQLLFYPNVATYVRKSDINKKKEIMDNLSKADEIILLTIYKLKDNAYGVTIRRKIEEDTKKLYGYGTLYSALDQLLKRGCVSKTISEPLAERGGRSRNYYKLTALGAQALKTAKMTYNSLWQNIEESELDMVK
ncbi:PadR family transcriptional regulator [candidate division KSB1 bacterium]